MALIIRLNGEEGCYTIQRKLGATDLSSDKSGDNLQLGFHIISCIEPSHFRSQVFGNRNSHKFLHGFLLTRCDMCNKQFPRCGLAMYTQ
jgi:hypothetical protein